MAENSERTIDLARLSADFGRDGFAVARGLFSPEEVAEIREAFMAEAANGPVEGLSDGVYHSLPADDPLAFYPRMMHPHRHPDKVVGPLSLRYMLHPKLYPLLREFTGGEPVAAQSMFYFKPAGARGQELHQDNYYLRVSPGTCCAAWLAIDDADEENGGMMAVPGTQDMEIACPRKADSKISFTSDYVAPPDGLKPVPVPLKAGDVMFFNGSVVHGSYPNTSKDRFRRAFICHYLPAESVELSHYYTEPRHFDGTAVAIPAATGGGPCGNGQAATGPH
jgi:phytanoyl-CoA hydroxylase